MAEADPTATATGRMEDAVFGVGKRGTLTSKATANGILGAT